MKVSDMKNVKSANKVDLLVYRANMPWQGLKAGEGYICKWTNEGWVKVEDFSGKTTAQAVAHAKTLVV